MRSSSKTILALPLLILHWLLILLFEILTESAWFIYIQAHQKVLPMLEKSFNKVESWVRK